MIILVVNAGSSSLKYQLIDMKNEDTLAQGMVDRIGSKLSTFKYKPHHQKEILIETEINDYTEAFIQVIKALVSRQYGVIKTIKDIGAVGHRIVHGGEKFSKSILIDETVIKVLEQNIALAPLHLPANLMGIKACKHMLPQAPMAGVFDTSFHQTMPKEAYLYGYLMRHTLI